MSSTNGTVEIDPVTPNLHAMQFHLVGDDELTGGVGGWEAVPRPRRKAAAEWAGADGWTLALPLLATGVDSTTGHDTSVEGTIRALTTASTKHPQTGQPPILKVTGPVRVPSSAMRWVVQSIEWGDQIRNDAGERVQQSFTLTLLEYVEAAVLLSPAKAAQARHASKSKKKKPAKRPTKRTRKK